METSGDNLHSGMLMARVRSTLPIYLNSITQDLQRSQSFVARYAGLAIPLRDFNRMYFIKIANGKPLRDVINEKWGDNATKYIDKMLKDLTQGRDADTNSILDRIRSKSAQAVLTLNPSVSIKQAASYPTAIAELDYKSVMRALVNPEGNSFLLKRADMELIQKYTPLLWSRMAGMSTQEIAELSMMQNKNAILTDWIRKVDVATVGRLWYATQYWVDDHYKNVEKGSDQYYKLVADKFEDVVTKTQPNYSVLTRPDILRTNNSLVKALMMFKTQPLQNFGLLFDSASRLNAKHRQYISARGTALEATALAEYRDAGAKFARTVTSQLLQTAVFTGMTFLANALVLHRWDKYKDDELNEITFASVMEQVMWDYADSLFGSAFMIDWAEDLGAYFIRRFALNEDVQYYGISVFGIDNINDLSDLVTKMSGAIKDGDSDKALKYAKNFAESIAQLVGIPASNVEKIIKSVWEYSLDFSQGRKITDLSGNTAGNYWHRIKNAYSNGENVDGLFDEMTDAVYDNMVSKESVRHFITENDDSGIMEWVSDMYVNGSAKYFNNQTNVDTNNRLISYDIRDLNGNLKTQSMLLILDYIWNRMSKNRDLGRATYIYFDEAHLLFNDEYCLEFLRMLWKRARKYGGILTGITQNVEDLLKDDKSRSMLANSEFLVLLKQNPTDAAKLQDVLHFTDSEIQYVNDTPPGHGILVLGGKDKIPFYDEFPKDTKLYEYLTTAFSETANMMNDDKKD